MEYGTNRKFCYNCGTELDADARFCPKCAAACEAQSAAVPTPIEQYNSTIQPKIAPKAKIDIKQTILSNIIPVICLGIGVILMLSGLGIRVPSEYISSYTMTEYVGGDAYNYIIEACLRGGNIAAAQINRSIYVGVGVLVACMSALKIRIVKPTKEAE